MNGKEEHSIGKLMIVLFLFFPVFILVYLLIYNNVFFFDFLVLKKLIFLIVNFFNLDFFYLFFNFLLNFIFFLNFFILIFLFFQLILKLIFFFFNFFVIGLLNFLFSTHIFFGQFFISADFIWRRSSSMSFLHFFSNIGFIILFVTFIILLFSFQYLSDWIYYPIRKDLGAEYSPSFYRNVENLLEKEYYDVITDDLLKDETGDLLQLWNYYENEPFNVFNFEDVEIQSNINPFLLSSMLEHTYVSTANRGNMFFNYNFGDEIKQMFYKLISKFELFLLNNSWKSLIDKFFFFCYLPCLVLILIFLIFSKINLVVKKSIKKILSFF